MIDENNLKVKMHQVAIEEVDCMLANLTPKLKKHKECIMELQRDLPKKVGELNKKVEDLETKLTEKCDNVQKNVTTHIKKLSSDMDGKIEGIKM